MRITHSEPFRVGVKNPEKPARAAAERCNSAPAAFFRRASMTDHPFEAVSAAPTSPDRWVTICAWTRRIRWQGRWITFEEFLAERFDLRWTHGICDEEAEKLCDPERQV